VAKKDPNTIQVIYRGGLADLPKAKTGGIDLTIGEDAFLFEPTNVSKKFWTLRSIPFASVTDVQIAERQVSTAEGLLGGLNSRQLNQPNNIHISYKGEGAAEVILRLEVLTGITVMGQAKKAAEFNDRLQALGVRNKFAAKLSSSAPPVTSDIPEQIAKLSALKDQGILSEPEFEAKKSELLSRM